MRLHRFYIAPSECDLDHVIWCRSVELRIQWLKVFRYKVGDQVIMFDGLKTERLYEISRIEADAIELKMVTDFERKLPARHIYLFWSLLKKDKNEWVIQKCTELGVCNFIPVIAERSEKTGFNIERANKISIEASEQCGRSDIAHIREPIGLDEVLKEYKDKVTLLICDEQTETSLRDSNEPVGVIIGPEGGWNEAERELLKTNNIGSLHLGNLTLRAETAAIAATTILS